MLLEAMVTESVMDDLMKDLHKNEIASIKLLELDPKQPKLIMVGASVTQDRLLEITQLVQATPSPEEFVLHSYDRLAVTSHEASGRYRLDAAQSEICYWAYKNEALL